MPHFASGAPTDRVDVVIVANFVSPYSPGNNRFADLARRLSSLGADVELVTSNFEHQTLSPRDHQDVPTDYKVTLLHEPGYRKNISVRRLISQHQFGKSVKRYLASRKAVPDLIFCATPPPEAARACAQYAEKRRVPFVVDIQDLWPDAFAMNIGMSRAINVLFAGMRRSSRLAYRSATWVLGVSQTYVTHAEKLTDTTLPTSVLYLGTTMEPEQCEPLEEPASSQTERPIQVAYAGTLSHSYDLPMVIDAIAALSRADERFAQLELVVLGDGPKRAEFEEHSRRAGVQAKFLGRVAYRDMLQQLAAADIAVNPIVPGSAGSVLNKASDYAAAGLPVVNTQESPEYRELINRYQAGVNCRPGDTTDVAAAIQHLVDHPGLRRSMGQANFRMAKELFDRNTTYDHLARELLKLAQGQGG